MSVVDQRRLSQSWDDERKPEVVAMPPQHEGVRNALMGSFDATPAMPPEFVRLLDRLR